MKKTYIVCGGLGFIGKNFCKTVARQEPESTIVVIDNLLSSSFSELEEFELLPNIKFIQENICNISFSRINMIMRDFGFEHVDEIWNFACIASPKGYRKYPMEVIDACTTGIMNICSWTKFFGCKLFHTSTSEVYGDTSLEMTEDNRGIVNCFGPRACYDEGKRIAETIIYEWIVRHGIDARIFRLFNTFGPGMAIDDGRVVSNFIVKAHYGLPIEIYGDPQKTRSFCYVDETIWKMRTAAEYYKSSYPINIGSDENEYTLLQIAQQIRMLSKSKSEIVTTDGLTDDPHNRRPNMGKFKNILEQHSIEEYHVSLNDGLIKTIQHFRNVLSNISRNDLLLRYTFKSYETPTIS